MKRRERKEEEKWADTMVIFKRNSGYSQDFFCLKRAPVF